MNVVDSSAWMEYFIDGPNASYFSGAIEKGSLSFPWRGNLRVALERGQALATGTRAGRSLPLQEPGR